MKTVKTKVKQTTATIETINTSTIPATVDVETVTLTGVYNEKKLRKHYANVIAVRDITVDTVTYELPLDKFLENATIVNDDAIDPTELSTVI